MIDTTKLQVSPQRFRRWNRLANLGVALVFLAVGLCLATIGQPWWWSALSFIPLIAAFLFYGYWSNKVWAQIDRVYGERMRP